MAMEITARVLIIISCLLYIQSQILEIEKITGISPHVPWSHLTTLSLH